MAAFSSLLVRYPPSQRHVFVAGAVRARPDLADRIQAAARNVHPARGYYGKDAKDYKEHEGQEIGEPCPPYNQFMIPFVPVPLIPQVPPVSAEQPPNDNID